jgi:hypothetical protein
MPHTHGRTRRSRSAVARLWEVTLVLASCLILPRLAVAQSFGVGSIEVGPTVGLGSIDDASLAIGGRLEWGYGDLQDLASGIVGLQVAVDYYSWSGAGYDFSIVPVGIAASYHFVLGDDRFDPFVGVGLGYSIVSCDGPASDTDPCENSSLYLIGRAGLRYRFWRSVSLYADAGAGAAAVNVGVSLRAR